MVRSQRKRSESNLYHVVSRGVARFIIFEDDEDRKRFLDALREHAETYGAKLHAFCLMDNHYHLLVEADLEVLSQMMRKLNSAYAMYFNLRHERDGHLFQGRFRSEPIDTDSYYLTALRYIHRNPEKAGICAARDYPWSSFGEYARGEKGLVDVRFALDLLGGVEGFLAFHAEPADAVCMDEGSGRRACADEDALEVANAVLARAGLRVGDVASLGRQERNAALRALKGTRLSVRQIERLTGVSKSVVAKA